jgi:hypothetical protein
VKAYRRNYFPCDVPSSASWYTLNYASLIGQTSERKIAFSSSSSSSSSSVTIYNSTASYMITFTAY